MAKNTNGALVTIKAFLPLGATIDEQFHAIGMLKDAATTGDYSAVLTAASIDGVDVKQITRRVADVVAEPAAQTLTTYGGTGDASQASIEQTGSDTSTEEAPKARGRKAT